MEEPKEMGKEILKKRIRPAVWFLILWSCGLLGLLVAEWGFGAVEKIAVGKGAYHCHILLVTGFYCPGCGGTRALWHFLHGRLWTAFFYHPAFVWSVILLPLIALYRILQVKHTLKRPDEECLLFFNRHFRAEKIWLLIFVILLLGNCIVRNWAFYGLVL